MCFSPTKLANEFSGSTATEYVYMVKLRGSAKKSFFSRLKQTVSHPKKDTEICGQKIEYPCITGEMLIPVDKPLSTRNALNIYKKHMLAIAYLEKYEIGDFLDQLREEMGEYEQHLKEEVRTARETLAEARAGVRSERKRNKRLTRESKDEDDNFHLTQDLAKLIVEVRLAEEELASSSAELANFKKDKRDFLINYINTEVHGSDWKCRGSD